MKNFIRRYWILESMLIVVALLCLALTFMRVVDVNALVAGSEETAVLAQTDPDSDPYPGPDDEADDEEGEDDPDFPEDEDSDSSEGDDEEFDDGEGDDEAEESEDDSDLSEDEDSDSSEGDEEEWEDDEADPIFLAAELIGVDIDALDEALANGKSLAEIAAENGVDAQTLTDALIQQELTLIDQLVQEGEISEDEATEWRNEVNQFTGFYVNTAYTDPELLAAQIIGIDIETLWDALDADQTVQEVAEANGVDAQDVINALIAAENEYAEQMFAAGLIDEAELNEWKAENEEFIQAIVTQSLSEFEDEFIEEEAFDDCDKEAEGEDA